MTLDERANLSATDYVASWGGGVALDILRPTATIAFLGRHAGHRDENGATVLAEALGRLARARPRSALLQAHADQLYRVWDGTGDGHTGTSSSPRRPRAARACLRR